MADPVRPTGMTKERIDPVRIDTQEIREYPGCPACWQTIIELCDEIDILRGQLASAEFKIRRQECLDALKAAIEKARQTGGHSHG